MKSTKRKWLIAALILLAAVGTFFVWPGSGPRHNGRRLSYWFREYYLGLEDNRRQPGANKSLEAIHAIGTNALSYLLEQAFSKKEDTALRTNYYEFLKEFPGRWHLPRFVSRKQIRESATYAIHSLDPPPEVLLLMMRRELDSTNSFDRRQVISIFIWFAARHEVLVPYIARCVNDPDEQTSEAGVQGLYDIGPAAALAVPELTTWLEAASPTNGNLLIVGSMLALARSNAALAIPALKARFEAETDWRLRCEWAAILCRIDQQQAYAMDYLLEQLKARQNARQASTVARSLGSIGSNGQVAIPALTEAMQSTNSQTWPEFLDAMKQIGVATNLYLSALIAKLKAPDEGSRYEAAKRILAIESANHESIAVMISLLGTNSSHASDAIMALGDAGTNALVAVPAILQVFDETEESDWGSVTYALRRIHPPKETVVPQLKGKLRGANEGLRLEVASAILAVDPENMDAQTALIEMIEAGSPYSPFAIKLLAFAGPAAKRAIPALQKASKSRNERISFAAEDALKSIEAKPAK